MMKYEMEIEFIWSSVGSGLLFFFLGGGGNLGSSGACSPRKCGNLIPSRMLFLSFSGGTFFAKKSSYHYTNYRQPLSPPTLVQENSGNSRDDLLIRWKRVLDWYGISDIFADPLDGWCVSKLTGLINWYVEIQITSWYSCVLSNVPFRIVHRQTSSSVPKIGDQAYV